MSLNDLYSAKKEDLYFPGRHANFFSPGPPKSEAALCVEMARLAYCCQKSDFAFDQGVIRNVLDCVGFTDCQFFESEGVLQSGGTHCFLALHRDTDKDKELAVVAFRGTDKDDPTDLADDAEVIPVAWEKGGKVHKGFAKALGEVRQNLDRTLRSVECRMLFTGHSLGAALATLLASARNPAALYTFGSPRVGDVEFVATLRGVDSHRYVDCADLVTRVPPESFGYVHLGKPYYIGRNRRVRFNPSRVWMWLDRFCADREYLVKYAWKIGNVAVRELADHAPINYVLAVSAAHS